MVKHNNATMPSVPEAMRSYTKKISLGERTRDQIDLEIELQRVAAAHGFCPVIHCVEHGAEECSVTMDYCGESLAAIYGEAASDVPEELFQQVHDIVATLFEVEGIEYIDITAYNFTVMDIARSGEASTGRVNVIDFGDAYYTRPRERDSSSPPRPVNHFLAQFLQEYGARRWNDDFA